MLLLSSCYLLPFFLIRGSLFHIDELTVTSDPVSVFVITHQQNSSFQCKPFSLARDGISRKHVSKTFCTTGCCCDSLMVLLGYLLYGKLDVAVQLGLGVDGLMSVVLITFKEKVFERRRVFLFKRHHHLVAQSEQHQLQK